MAQSNAWKHGTDWWVRTPDGQRVNLNTAEGASLVLRLLDLEQEARAQEPAAPKRKKPGPSETKGA